MLAPNAVAHRDIEARFLASLRETAAFLPKSKEAFKARLQELVALCAQDLNLNPKDVSYLIGDFNIAKNHKSLIRFKKKWERHFLRLPRFRSDRPRVVVLLPDGQSIRSFLRTDAMRKFSQWADLIVLSPLDIEADIRRLGPNAGFLPILPIRRTRFDTMVGFLGYLQTGSSTNRQMAARLDENLNKAVAEGTPLETSLRIWRIAQSLRSDAQFLDAYCWSLRLFASIFSLGETAALLRGLQPDLVFNTSLISWPSRLWTRAAALEGIPVISNVISWDNMSTKTLLDEFVDSFLIWSGEMDEDFTTTLSFAREKPRTIVGTPQFEPIIERRGLVSRTDFFGRYNLDPDKKLILYTTGSKTLFPREAECLDTVLGHWRDHLQDRANIMVRMHPKDRRGRYDAVVAKFPEVPFTLAGENLSAEDDWVPSDDDIDLLVNQLNHCDVIVNVASTMTLEGFAIDKPAINIGFTLGPSVSQRYPMDDYYKSRHYRDVVDTGAARLVNDYPELFAAIDDVLDRDAFDVEKQRRVLHMKCSYIANSSDRIDDYLKHYAAHRTASAPPRLRQLRWLVSRIAVSSTIRRAQLRKRFVRPLRTVMRAGR